MIFDTGVIVVDIAMIFGYVKPFVFGLLIYLL